jgi:hypothetical protein
MEVIDAASPVHTTLVSSSNSEADRKRIRYHYVNLTHQALMHAFADCDKAIFSAAKAADIPVLDLSDMLTGPSELFVDHVHTTPAGSATLVQATADFLGNILDSRREGVALGR